MSDDGGEMFECEECGHSCPTWEAMPAEEDVWAVSQCPECGSIYVD